MLWEAWKHALLIREAQLHDWQSILRQIRAGNPVIEIDESDIEDNIRGLEEEISRIVKRIRGK